METKSMISEVFWVLLVIVALHGDLSDTQDQALIIATLQEKLLCSCVFLVGESTPATLELQKMLNTASAILNYNSLESAFCGELSLYVLLDSTLYVHQTHMVFLKTCASSVWLVLSTSPDPKAMFWDLHVPFNSQLYVTQRSESGEVTLWELYRVADNLPLIKNLCGNLVHSHLSWTHKHVYQRRPHLSGLTLRLATKKDYPPAQLNELTFEAGYVTNTQFYSAMIKFWIALQERMNFSCHYVPMPRSSTDDIVFAVANNQVDFGLGDVSMTARRLGYVDFVTPLYMESAQIFIKQGGNASLHWGSFLEPFCNTLWLTVVTSIVVIAVHLKLLHSWQRRNGLTDSLTLNSLSDCLICVIGAFCLQGHSPTPCSNLTRSVLLVAYITSVILLAAYSAALISHLAVSSVVMPCNDVEDCLNKGSYTFFTLKGTSQAEFLQNSTNPTAKRVFSRLTQISLTEYEIDNALSHLCSSHFGMLWDVDYLKSVKHLLPCEIVALPGLLDTTQISFPTPKGSPYTNVFNYNLNLFREGGISRKLMGYSRMTQLPQETNTLTTVGMLDVAPILTALGVGYLLAVIVLLLEQCVHRLRTKYSPPLTLYVLSDETGPHKESTDN